MPSLSAAVTLRYTGGYWRFPREITAAFAAMPLPRRAILYATRPFPPVFAAATPAAVFREP